MFESSVDPGSVSLAAVPDVLRGLDQDVDAAVRVDRIRLLEQLKGAVAAAQAVETVALRGEVEAVQAGAGVKPEVIARSVAGQVGLARRVSPFHARRYVGWATILTRELPGTFAALAAGRVSEWRAMIVARETAWLSREHRAVLDAQIAPRLESWGDRRVELEARRLAYRLDPAGAAAKLRGAQSDRRVTVRPAPDTMARLTALLPVAHGVGAYAALLREADRLIGLGDGRGRGQIMADLLVARVTGQAAPDVPVEINLIMTVDSLLDPDGPGGTEPAHLDGYGPLPAPLARHLALGAGSDQAMAPRWLRRLFTSPDGRDLVALDSRRRAFTAGQRRYLQARDQFCRTPYCDAPIRHADHIHPAETGGPTQVHNGRGQCETCNYTNQSPGWRSRALTDQDTSGHDVETSTPTGHRYRSQAPDLPGAAPPSPLQQRIAHLVKQGRLAA
jgi:hypothetical protein